MLKKNVILFLLALTGCSTTQSNLSTQVSKVDSRLLETPVSASLLIPCRVAYPLRENASETSLKAFYEVLVYNLGQVEKCYNKDEALVEEISKRKDYVEKPSK